MTPINIDMSDPLTLGMGHPVTERIRRLSMRKSNSTTRVGTVAVIVAALGVTTPIISNAAAGPVASVVDTIINQPELVSSEAKLGLAETSPVLTPNQIAPPEQPKVQKLAQLQASVAAAPTGLKPMRLRMAPEFTPNQIAEIETQRQSFVDGNKEESVPAINRIMSEVNLKNRLEVTISDNGQSFVKVSQGKGGWPGFPATNTGWERRSLSTAMHNGLKPIIDQCAKSKNPFYFMATLTDGDSDIGKGDFRVGCTPGSDLERAKVTYVDLAQAFLASDDLPLDTRQTMANLTFFFGLMSEYVTTTPNATISQDRVECVRIHETTKKEYGLNQSLRDASDRFLAKCAKTNYNWVRQRENVPVVE